MGITATLSDSLSSQASDPTYFNTSAHLAKYACLVVSLQVTNLVWCGLSWRLSRCLKDTDAVIEYDNDC